MEMINWNEDDGVFLPMLNDKGRNLFYQDALALKAPGKTVVDIGAGTGFLSVLAMRAGAKNVIAVEQDFERYNLAKQIIHECGLSKDVELVHGDWLEQNITGDIYVSETIDTHIWNENILLISEHAIRNGGEFIPGRFEYRFKIYTNHPLFSVCQSESEAFDFQPDIEVDSAYEQAISQKARDETRLYVANPIFNLFQAVKQYPTDMEPVIGCFEQLHVSDWYKVDLNVGGHSNYSQFQHKFNLMDLPKRHGYCILVEWQAKTEGITMELWDTIFGTLSKVIPEGTSKIETGYDSLIKKWIFKYE